MPHLKISRDVINVWGIVKSRRIVPIDNLSRENVARFPPFLSLYLATGMRANAGQAAYKRSAV